MFLQLNHKELRVYAEVRKMIFDCYRITNSFPSHEKFGLVSQIRRAATSVLLNVAEGAARKSEQERGRFYEVSRSSLIEVDAAFDIANGVGYISESDVTSLGKSINKCFQQLTGMINSCN